MDKEISRTFSIKEVVQFGWQTTKKNFWLFLQVILISFVINWGLSYVTHFLTRSHDTFLKTLAFLLTTASIILGFGLSYATFKIYFKIIDGKRPQIKELFSYFKAKPIFGYFLISVLYDLMVAVGLLLFIVPGIYFGITYKFALYCYIDKKTTIGESFRESARITQGVKWKLFLLGLLQILICIGGFFALVVGLFFAIPTNFAADIYLYRQLSEKK